MDSRSPRMVVRWPKGAPRWFKRMPRWPKRVPRWLKMMPRCCHDRECFWQDEPSLSSAVNDEGSGQDKPLPPLTSVVPEVGQDEPLLSNAVTEVGQPSLASAVTEAGKRSHTSAFHDDDSDSLGCLCEICHDEEDTMICSNSQCKARS